MPVYGRERGDHRPDGRLDLVEPRFQFGVRRGLCRVEPIYGGKELGEGACEGLAGRVHRLVGQRCEDGVRFVEVFQRSAQEIGPDAEQLLGEEGQEVVAVSREVGPEVLDACEDAPDPFYRIRVDQVVPELAYALVEHLKRLLDHCERDLLEVTPRGHLPDEGVVLK